MPNPNQQLRSATAQIPPMMLRASFAPDSINEEKRTVDVVWTTGAKVLRGYYDQFYEELSLDSKHVRMERLNNGAPFLADHNSYSIRSVLAVVVDGSAKLRSKDGVATIRFASAETDPEADKVFRKIKEGILRNVSVGYRVFKYEQTTETTGNKVVTRKAVDWEPFEISCVTVGADDKAGFRSEVASNNSCEFISFSESRNMPDENNNPAPVAAPPSVANPAAAVEEATRAAVAADRVRIAAVRTAVFSAIRREENGSLIRSGITQQRADELINVAIEKGTTLEQVRSMILDDMLKDEQTRSIDGTNRIDLKEDEEDKYVRGAEAWLIAKSGLSRQMQDAKNVLATNPTTKFRAFETDPGEFRGMSLLDLARDCLQRRGVKIRGLSKRELAGMAFTYRSGGMHSTSDFANILENAMHKVLLGSYAITPDTWSQFCLTGSASDFRPIRRNRMGSFNRLDKLNEHGEFKNKQIPDSEKELIAVKTLGNIIALTREAIINDDMDAFSRLATWLGRAAKLSIEMDVYDLLALNSGLGPTLDSDSLPVFDAAHLNIGSTAAISTTALDADATLMAQQKDVSKNEILDLSPSILLVPRGLKGEANSLNEAQYDTDTAGKFQKPNKVRGLFNTIIGTARLSGTRRYLLANPSVAPVFEVLFLDGVQEPFMDTKEGWRSDGVEWKVRMDYGVDAIDFRGGVTNAG